MHCVDLNRFSICFLVKADNHLLRRDKAFLLPATHNNFATEQNGGVRAAGSYLMS